MRNSYSRGNFRPTPVVEALPKPSRAFPPTGGPDFPRGPNLAKFRRIAKGFIKLFKIHFAAKRRQAAPSSERTGLGHVRSVIRARLRLPVPGADNRPARAKSGTVFPGSAPIAERTEPSAPSIDLPATKAIAGNPPSFYGGRRLPAPRPCERSKRQTTENSAVPAPSSGLAVRI